MAAPPLRIYTVAECLHDGMAQSVASYMPVFKFIFIPHQLFWGVLQLSSRNQNLQLELLVIPHSATV